MKSLYQVMYTTAWFFIGFFTMFFVDHIISQQYEQAMLDVFIIALNWFNQRNLWGR